MRELKCDYDAYVLLYRIILSKQVVYFVAFGNVCNSL